MEDPVELLTFPEAEKQTQRQTAESNLLVIKKTFSPKIAIANQIMTKYLPYLNNMK